MSISIHPLEDRIVIRPLDAEQTTSSGLVIPDTVQEKPQQGKVVADDGQKNFGTQIVAVLCREPNRTRLG